MVDPYMIGTAGFGLLFVAQTARASLLSNRCKWLNEEVHDAIGRIGRLSREVDTQRIQIDQHERAEAKRQAQRIAASKRAHAVMADRRAKEAEEAPARTAKTLQAFKSSPMPSRDEVVAPVREKRAKAKAAA